MQERVLEDLEPVRLEFPYADAKKVRTAAIVCSAFYVAVFVWPLGIALAEPRQMSCLLAMLLGMLALCEALVWSWHYQWSSRPPEVVILDGTTMRVVRQGVRGAPAQSEFNLLEIHDLRIEQYLACRYALVWPLPKTRRPAVYDSAEPIRFTYRHMAYSMGGAQATQALHQLAVDRILAYDAEVRFRLGMSDAPNAGTFDSERAVRAAADGWDVDVPPDALE